MIRKLVLLGALALLAAAPTRNAAAGVPEVGSAQSQAVAETVEERVDEVADADEHAPRRVFRVHRRHDAIVEEIFEGVIEGCCRSGHRWSAGARVAIEIELVGDRGCFHASLDGQGRLLRLMEMRGCSAPRARRGGEPS